MRAVSRDHKLEGPLGLATECWMLAVESQRAIGA